jgi:hypothetical protein
MKTVSDKLNDVYAKYYSPTEHSAVKVSMLFKVSHFQTVYTKEINAVTHACHKRQLKWVPSAWGYSWTALSPGVLNMEACSSRFRVGRWTNNPAL